MRRPPVNEEHDADAPRCPKQREGPMHFELRPERGAVQEAFHARRHVEDGVGGEEEHREEGAITFRLPVITASGARPSVRTVPPREIGEDKKRHECRESWILSGRSPTRMARYFALPSRSSPAGSTTSKTGSSSAEDSASGTLSASEGGCTSGPGPTRARMRSSGRIRN